MRWLRVGEDGGASAGTIRPGSPTHAAEPLACRSNRSIRQWWRDAGRVLWDLRRYRRKTGLPFTWTPARGKGGHGLVEVNGVSTTVQCELNENRVERILKQLNLPKGAV